MKLLNKVFALSLLSFCSTAFGEQKQPEKKEVITLTPNSFVRLTDEVNEQSATRFIKDFLSQTSNEVTVFIDSPGGDVLDGLRMIETVRSAKAAKPNLKVKCVVGSAASMAFYFLQTACDERLVLETSVLMQHQAQVGVRGPVRQLDSRFSLIHALIDWLDNESAKRLGLTVKELREKVSNDWWVVGKDAVKQKAADKVVNITCSLELMNAPPLEDKKAACPLVYGVSGGSGQGKLFPKNQ